MPFFFKLLPFSIPFSFWLLLGTIIGIFSLNLFPFLLFPFLTFFTFIIIFFRKNKHFFLILLCCGGFIAGGARIVYIKKRYLTPAGLTEKQLLLIKEIIKTGNIHWPCRITVEQTGNPHLSFFIFCKKIEGGEIGDTIEAPQIFFKKPNTPSFLCYLFKEGATGTAFIKEFCPVLIKRPHYSFSRWAYNKRTTILNSLRKKLSPSSFSFFCSLFIGDKKQKNYLTEKYKPLFKQWGISHHMARSGLHLVIFIILWQLLLSFVPLSFAQKHFFLFLLCFFYFFITPLSISFFRAFFLFVFYKFCVFNSWQIHGVHLICLVSLITLLYNPFQLFFLDFQLSFFLTFCLSWLSHLNGQRQSGF